MPKGSLKNFDAFQLHGQLMILTWVILAPCSILLAKFGRRLLPPSFGRLHIWLHILINSIMGLTGGYAVYVSISNSKWHLISAHQKLGVLIASLSTLQGLLGLMMVSMGGLWKRVQCCRLRCIHGILGPVLWFLAMINAVLGMEMLGWNASVYLSAYIFLTISIYLYLSHEMEGGAAAFDNDDYDNARGLRKNESTTKRRTSPRKK